MRCFPVFIFCLSCISGWGQSLLEESLRAERWIRSSRIEKSNGITWAVVPGDTTLVTNLYSGSAGIVLFYLELYQATRNNKFLDEAKRGADYLAGQLNKPLTGFDEVGFYTGEAGICFTLKKVFDLTGEKRYDEAMNRSWLRLTRQAKQDDRFADWRYTDIVYGGAGIGLMLLALDNPEARTLAIKTGKSLVRQAEDAPVGKKWFMDSSMARQHYYMPNFSHGTAGVSYFLARLYQATHEKGFLDAALAGASHLASIENKDAWIFHDDRTDRKEMYYLSWCHGPAGTARLYYLLYQITKDQKWMDKISKAAKAIMQCGIPEKQTDGFWNNQGPCCGSAGVAEYFLDLYKVTGDKEYLIFSRHVTDHLVSHSSPDGDMIKWVQSEHRSRPDLLQAQTGYMQGASGIGMWLLHLYAYENKKPVAVRLPDDPF